MIKLNLCVSGSVLVSGLASFCLAAQPIQAANIELTGTNGNWNIIESGYNPTNGFVKGDDQFALLEEATDLGPFDVEIALTGYTPNTSVQIELVKFVSNNSNTTWTDFHISIGTGLGSEFIQSDPSSGLFAPTIPIGDSDVSTPLDFANLISEGSFGFAQVTNSGNYISFYDGTILPQASDPANGTIPLFILNVPTDANGDAIFTLRQTASAVPEPFTILGAGAALGFGSFFKRQKDKNNKKKSETII